MLLIAAGLIVILGLGHSIIGERRLISPLLKQDNLPIILGSLSNTKRTLRVAWHIVTLNWLGIAALMVSLQYQWIPIEQAFLIITAVTFGFCGVLSLVASRGKHFSWSIFMLIALCSSVSLLL